MLRWRSLLVLAALACHVIGCAGAPPAQAPTSGRVPDDLITVVTLNLYHDKEAWPERRPAIVAELRELRPDVIALQEVIGNQTVRNQAESLAEELGYECTFSSTDPVGGPKRYGNAILTRHPLVRRGWVRLRPLDDSRTAAHVRIALGGRAVNVYVTHLHHSAEGAALRAQQVADLLGFVRATDGGAPSIIAGDLNAESTSPELGALAREFSSSYDVLHSEAARDARAHTTLNPHFFPLDHRRIDHIYVERGRFAPLESRIILDRADSAGRWPSDHFGLMTRVRILCRAGTSSPGCGSSGASQEETARPVDTPAPAPARPGHARCLAVLEACYACRDYHGFVEDAQPDGMDSEERIAAIRDRIGTWGSAAGRDRECRHWLDPAIELEGARTNEGDGALASLHEASGQGCERLAGAFQRQGGFPLSNATKN